MEIEERLQVGLAALVEIAEIERERAGQHQEDHDEHVRDRRREIAAQLALEDRDDRRSCARLLAGCALRDGAEHLVEAAAFERELAHRDALRLAARR